MTSSTDTVFGYIFAKNRHINLKFSILYFQVQFYKFYGFLKFMKIDTDHFLNAENRTNFENRENPEIAWNSVKNWPFSDLQNNKTQPFFMIYTCNFVYIYT